jgi:hypothetical protein
MLDNNQHEIRQVIFNQHFKKAPKKWVKTLQSLQSTWSGGRIPHNQPLLLLAVAWNPMAQ